MPSVVLSPLRRCVCVCSLLGMSTIASSISLYPSTMSLSTPTLSSAGSSSITSWPLIMNLDSESTMSFHLLPIRIESSNQPSMIMITTTGRPAPTHRPSPVPQPPAQRQQQDIQAMTFGGAIYTTVLASLGTGICLSSLYASLRLTSSSCSKSFHYGCYGTFKTDVY